MVESICGNFETDNCDSGREDWSKNIDDFTICQHRGKWHNCSYRFMSISVAHNLKKVLIRRCSENGDFHNVFC